MDQPRDDNEQPGNMRNLKRAIIFALLVLVAVGILVASQIRVIGNGLETRTMAEVRTVSAAIQGFKKHYRVDHIPSRIVLCKYRPHYDLPAGDPRRQLFQDSLAYITQVWPRLRWTNDAGQWISIEWDGTTGGGDSPVATPPAASATNVFTLDGSQCLVFFLGGIPSHGPSPGCDGFSINPANPAARTTERVSPFYEFMSNHLVRLHGNAFYSYLDAFGQQP